MKRIIPSVLSGLVLWPLVAAAQIQFTNGPLAGVELVTLS
jgi:hypothetical protein